MDARRRAPRRGTRPRPSPRDGSPRLSAERMPCLARSGVQIAGAVMHAATVLQSAARHVRESAARVERQAELIRRLHADGADTRNAVHALMMLVVVFEGHRQRLSGLLDLT